MVVGLDGRAPESSSPQAPAIRRVWPGHGASHTPGYLGTFQHSRTPARLPQRLVGRNEGPAAVGDSPLPASPSMAKRPTGRKSAGKSAKKNGAARTPTPSAEAKSYTHPEATFALRPDVGVQAQVRKKKPPRTSRYDSSLSPALEWDEQPARGQGELLADILKPSRWTRRRLPRAAQGDVGAVPQLGGEGGAAVVRRADAAAVRARAALHQGDPRDAQGHTATSSWSWTCSATRSAPADQVLAPTSTATTGSTG